MVMEQIQDNCLTAQKALRISDISIQIVSNFPSGDEKVSKVQWTLANIVN